MAVRAFGRYRVLGRLATGGMASIFLAREITPEGPRLVCIKILLPERARDPDLVAMFIDEGKLAKRLRHDNCVEIFEQDTERGVPYIVMEYIAGVTLWELIESFARRRERPTPLAVASVVAAACRGLHHAHELGDDKGRPYNLVHRDVSPENIMVTYGGHTKLLDFGVVKAETSRPGTRTGIIKGKYSYMSPEQITGGRLDRRSDIFALGVVLFEALTARGLFRADSPNEIAALVIRKPIPRIQPLNDDVDDELEAIVNRALARPPGTRYQTAAEMADALYGWLDRASTTPTSTLLGDVLDTRFGHQIEDRRRVCQAALEGTYEESELLEVLGARPVFDVDLFGGLFSQDVATLTDAAGKETRDEAAAGGARGDGWMVEVRPVTAPQEVLRMRSVPRIGARGRDTTGGAYDAVAGDTVHDDDNTDSLAEEIRAAGEGVYPTVDAADSDVIAAVAIAGSASTEQVGLDPADLIASDEQTPGFVPVYDSPDPKPDISTTASEVPHVVASGGRLQRVRTMAAVFAGGVAFGVGLGLFMAWTMISIVAATR